MYSKFREAISILKNCDEPSHFNYYLLLKFSLMIENKFYFKLINLPIDFK